MRVFCFVSLLVISGVSANLLDPLELKVPTGSKSNVGILQTEEDVMKTPQAVVFVTNQPSDPQADLLSHLTSVRSTPFSVFVAPEGVLKNVAEGQIAVYYNGSRFLYRGLHDAVTILKYALLVENNGIKTIANKNDKIAFDRVKGTKLVGYFTPGSEELTVFEQSAGLFRNQVAFFVVTDPLVAKHVKLNVTGQIYLVREFDKTPVACSKNPATLPDIQQLIVHNKNKFVKVTPMDVKDTSFNQNPAVVLLTDSTSLSMHVLKLVTRIYRNTTENYPRVFWIETTEFPVIDFTAGGFHNLTKLPGLGFWDPTLQSVNWMDLSILNAAPTDRIQEDENLTLINAFFTSLLPPSPPTTGTEL